MEYKVRTKAYKKINKSISRKGGQFSKPAVPSEMLSYILIKIYETVLIKKHV